MRDTVKRYLARIPPLFRALRAIRRFLRPPTLQERIAKALADNPSVFFVQVGSNDGVRGDPIHDLIVENSGWKGMFIEPVKHLFEKLKSNYQGRDGFIFENVAVGTERGARVFYHVSEEARRVLGAHLPNWYDQVGSFDRQHIANLVQGKLEPFIVEETVQCVPLQDVLSAHGVDRIDLLHIDTEGFDYKVLAQLDFSKYRPAIVLFEHRHLSDEEKQNAASLLKSEGYRCRHCGADTLAVRKNLRAIPGV